MFQPFFQYDSFSFFFFFKLFYNNINKHNKDQLFKNNSPD